MARQNDAIRDGSHSCTEIPEPNKTKDEI